MFKFLNLKPEIFAVDVNDLSLRIVKLKKKHKGFHLVSYNEVDIAPGIVKEGVIQDEVALAKIISLACSTVKGKKLDTNYIVASLPEEKSFSQVIQMPNMTEQELKLSVPFEAENYIPLPIDKVYLDFQVIKKYEKKKGHLDLLINAMPKTVVDSYVSCFKKAGLLPCILETESQAIARVFLKNHQNALPVVLVDFGETKTSLSIYAENSIRFTVTFSISSNQLTQAVSKELGISFGTAEKLKIQYGLNKESSKKYISLASAMEPILNNLVDEIKKYIHFYQGHSHNEYFPSDGVIQKVILCGGGSRLINISDFFSKKLSIPVELGNPFLNVTVSKNIFFPKDKALSFATAIGSALRGAGDTYLNSYENNI